MSRRSTLLSSATLAVVAAAAAAAAPAHAAVIASASLLGIATAVAADSVVALGRRARLTREAAARSDDRPVPAQLRDVARALELSVISEFELDRSLRPILRPVARARLERSGVDLDRDEAKARTLLGEDAWELVRPDRPRAGDRTRHGWPEARLRAVVDRLERLP